MKKAIACLFMSTMSNLACAAWIEASGTVNRIATYAHTDTVLVYLSGGGTQVAECTNKTVFAISGSMSSERRARMFSMLLAAKASGTSVIVGYNNVGGCEPWDADQNAYRKITRLR